MGEAAVLGSLSLPHNGKNLSIKLLCSSTWSQACLFHQISSSPSEGVSTLLFPPSSSSTNPNTLDGTASTWDSGGRSTQSLGAAEEQMARNGGALKRHIQIPNTAKDTCTEAETVQESLWKFSPPLPPPPLRRPGTPTLHLLPPPISHPPPTHTFSILISHLLGPLPSPCRPKKAPTFSSNPISIPALHQKIAEAAATGME